MERYKSTVQVQGAFVNFTCAQKWIKPKLETQANNCGLKLPLTLLRVPLWLESA